VVEVAQGDAASRQPGVTGTAIVVRRLDRLGVPRLTVLDHPAEVDARLVRAVFAGLIEEARRGAVLVPREQDRRQVVAARRVVPLTGLPIEALDLLGVTVALLEAISQLGAARGSVAREQEVGQERAAGRILRGAGRFERRASRRRVLVGRGSETAERESTTGDARASRAGVVVSGPESTLRDAALVTSGAGRIHRLNGALVGVFRARRAMRARSHAPIRGLRRRRATRSAQQREERTPQSS